jgi:molecular chaperone DnaJ
MAPQREWFETDYYKVLGVPESATAKEITRAYRKLARQHHPDANPGDAAAEERFKEISAAYDVVGDETKRPEYDQVRKMGPVGGYGPGGPGGFGAGGFGGPGGFTFEGDVGGLGDLLGGLFGRGGRAGPGRGAGPRKGDDLEAELHLAFEDAVHGVTTSVHLTSDAPCRTCHGTGAKPGTAPHVCPQCGGRGVLDDNQGMFSFSQPCPQCGGRGQVIDEPCPVCHGSGAERRPREVKVRIPAGVTAGSRIRLKGRGGPGRNGGPQGDLYVVVQVAPHERFGIDGRNLTLALPITFPEAALGADIKVPTIDDGTVTLRIPPGTTPGRTFRVRGRGIASPKGTGDLLVTVELAVPRKLSAKERKALEAFAELQSESPRAHLEV